VGYCQQEGLALDLVFADMNMPSTQSLRPGWTALLDVLALRDARLVVVPSGDHLSRDPTLQAKLRTQLGAVGAVALALPRTVVRS
jgi:hypothetical protein